jgi:hypothetical protein
LNPRSLAFLAGLLLWACGGPSKPPESREELATPDAPVPEGYRVTSVLDPARIEGRVRRSDAALTEAVVYLRGLNQGRPWDPVPAAARDLTWAEGGEARAPLLWPAGALLRVHGHGARTHSMELRASGPGTLAVAAFELPPAAVHDLRPPEGFLSLECTEHEVRRWLVVRRSPYGAVADIDGRFRIDGVPPGPVEVVVWHPEHASVGYELVVPAALGPRETLVLDLVLD